MSMPGSPMGHGVGASPVTRDNGAIRQKAGHLEQLNGRVRSINQEMENFRSRVSGFYEEARVRENVTSAPQPEHRTDLDELQAQLHILEGSLDVLENHVREIQSI